MQTMRKTSEDRSFGHRGLGFALRIALAAVLFHYSLAQFEARAAEPETLSVLARIGPWPVVSEPVLYRGRLWFANSVKDVDHNSADIYSLGPGSAEPRYERHLWSQDAGQPVVADGLLYWPSEDSRIFGAWGEFQVTNGEGWETGIIPSEFIFHLHNMTAAQGRLYAATSAWQGALHSSENQGRTWQRIYLHPRGPKGVSRIVSLTKLENGVAGLLRDPDGFHLIVAAPDGVRMMADWPISKSPTQLTSLGGWAHGLVHHDGVRELWRSDGVVAEQVFRFGETVRPFALTSGDGALWALSGGKSEGAVLKSVDGRAWSTVARFSGGKAYDLLAADGALVVTGAGTDGQGILWGWSDNTSSAGDAPFLALPELTGAQPPRQIDWKDAAARLDALLTDEESYARIGWPIRTQVLEYALAGPPENFFADRLESPRATGAVHPFRDVEIPDRGSIGAFWLLWGLGLANNGTVPPNYIADPWTVRENGAEKYFEPQLMALWAAAEIGQADYVTIDALMTRITNSADPLWLRMDAVGALSALTGATYGADFEAWAGWYGR
ncbi:MAG: hypothetical protein O3B21_02650 [Proteobacteria bacterium]|nr:hypothetical protein [Pseudomonadota bacterium]MDA1354697.1 hypothetical protein [Pseudomonadota bacterium]